MGGSGLGEQHGWYNCILFVFVLFIYWIEHRTIYKNANNFAMAIGKANNNAIGPYWAAPLQPSVVQVSQNSVRMYDGVLRLKHSFFGASWRCQKHDRETMILPLTVLWNKAKEEEIFFRKMGKVGLKWEKNSVKGKIVEEGKRKMAKKWGTSIEGRKWSKVERNWKKL